MSSPEEMEFTEQFSGSRDVTGEIGGEISVPLGSEELEDSTLDEPVLTTLVCKVVGRGLQANTSQWG